MWVRTAFGLGVLAALAGCFAHEGVLPETGEEALEFRVTTVDTSLPDVDAIGYEIDLRVNGAPGSERFVADVKGTYVATRDLEELVLDFDGNEIDGVVIGSEEARYRRAAGRLVVTLPERTASGRTMTSRIRYHGAVAQADGADPNDFEAFGGLNVRQRNAEGQRIFSSLNWPRKARRWLPLRDHPSDGAMVAMSLTFPKSFTVLANGKRVSRVEGRRGTDGEGTTTWRYQALTPMPTYDFHVTAYESWKVDEARSSSGVPIATYTYSSAHRHQKAIYGDLPKALDYYEKTFGKYRWGSASFVEEPIFGGGMEHASVVSMDETLFASPSGARKTAFHELAHHWSGNLARFRSWNDFWLSEGFTEYLTARFIADNDGPAAARALHREYLARALDADRAYPHPVRPPDPEIDVLDIFDAISYQKGALVLRALERIVGGETLTTFLRGWFDRHASKPATTADFVKELQGASGRDLTKFFEGFVYGTYHPEVRVALQVLPNGEAEIEVAQVQKKGPKDGFAFPLDVDVVDTAGAKERVTIELTGKQTKQRFRFDRDVKSIVVDPDETMLGTVACSGAAGDACKQGFRCASSEGSVCVPDL